VCYSDFVLASCGKRNLHVGLSNDVVHDVDRRLTYIYISYM